jgi:hypothetical protein
LFDIQKKVSLSVVNNKTPSDQIGYIHWHLIDLCRVELLNITQDAHIFILDKVDGNTFATESTRTTNPKSDRNKR